MVTTVLMVLCVLAWLRVGLSASRHWWARERERGEERYEHHVARCAPLPPLLNLGEPDMPTAVVLVLLGPGYWLVPAFRAVGRTAHRAITGERP